MTYELDEQPLDHAGMAILDYDECLRLLAVTPVGRVAFAAEGEIVILPVNYVLDGTTVVFRSDGGAKLTAAQEAKTVAFEVDGWDQALGEGWSVIINGRAETVYGDADIERLAGLALQPWGDATARRSWVMIHPDSVSGRRVAPR